MLNALESLVWGQRINNAQVDHPPIFLLGHWRSGTTMLHNLVTLNPRTTYMNLYQCLFPGHFLLTEKVIGPLTEFLLPKTRPMDRVKVSWSTPQEDEIALAVSTLLSPYIMMAFHGRPEVYRRYFDPQDMHPEEQQRWEGALLTLVRKMSLLHNGPVVMKSPAHTYRIPTLLKLFPNAKFVYIVRNPLAVFPSTINLRKAMFTDNTLGELLPEVQWEEVFQFSEACYRKYEATKHLIPEGNLFELKFEDLESRPIEMLRKMHQSLGLPGWEDTEPRVREAVAGFSGYKKNAYNIDDDLREIITSRLKWIFDLYDYPLAEVQGAAA
ncbi:MAG: sulfotransferase [Planctomycetaceae bacterium]|nr:sulfotransferase [Planctomycetaceae bacterium]MCA9045093.1 sulfotransferase [Planctomycetaceae bacterium]